MRAAGGVLWRPGAGEPGAVEVAVVHRPRYDDWSLPKGHVDDGEHRAVTAVREIVEETGFSSVLGRHLGETRYPVKGREKVVDHWTARSLGGEFAANEETDELRWLPVADARALLTHASDAAVLDRFATAPADTTTLLLVRHATAENDGGDDAERALTPAGRDQARALVPLALAFGVGTGSPDALHAADRLRCEQTVQPLAEHLGVAFTSEPGLSEPGWERDPEGGLARADELRGQVETVLLCSQGGVVPTLVMTWARAHRVRIDPRHLRTPTASTWVISSAGGRVVALDHLPDPYA